MASSLPAGERADVTRLGKGEKLSTIERIAVLAVVGTIVTFDTVGLFLPPGLDPLTAALGIASTAVLALYLWSPLIATYALGVVFALSFIPGIEAQVLTTAAFAAGLIVRLGWTSLVLSYAGVFLLASALVVTGDSRDAFNIAIFLVGAAVSGAVGFALRIAFARGRTLEVQLAEKAEQERQAVLAERRWIAGELHDSIAHHLTVVALHVQMLDDDRTSSESQEAIRIAARKAMTDLRFVIDLADDGPRSEGMPSGDLAASVDEAQQEFESAGHAVIVDGDPSDERIPRAAEIILARILRESATNVLKYAGEGEVLIRFDIDDDSAKLTVSSPLSVTPRRELSSSRTGVGRMAERVLGASGEFSAGEADGRWVVSALLPIV
ncbi:histidine kinase [Microbacterium sp. APC 3901]|uniref:sensor histidine kinase n=1 Tax=Microbacterium sp. APC 3901 TaxID=3035192 RepID=UPI0025B5496F|nr:histidine kinase [Microbacterium sp. APC 3901]MDN3442698.1 histidine kinase [Microbacterium sp. APC 3901]